MINSAVLWGVGILCVFCIGLVAWGYRRLQTRLHTLMLEKALALQQCEQLPVLNAALGAKNVHCDELQAQNVNLRERVVQLETTLNEADKQSQEKLALLDNAKQQLHLEFKTLAQRIFEQKNATLTADNQKHISQLLQPLRQQLQMFTERVDRSYEQGLKDHTSLRHEIKQMALMNKQMSDDAVNLTRALTGQNKVQGSWGELILTRVLEQSGLEQGREYEIQVSLKNEAGKTYQPDVVVHLPDNKLVIVDAKVSLIAYESFCVEEDEHKREAALSQHIQSIRQHIKSLSQKGYHQLTSGLDFVLLFMPIEAALGAALRYQPTMFDEAMRLNVILVTPFTLLSTLRTIENLWRFERQNKNAEQIAKKAGDLYDKFVGFVADLNDIGKKLSATQDTYQAAWNKLQTGRGNLIKRAQDIKTLGAKTSKQLDSDLITSAVNGEELSDESV